MDEWPCRYIGHMAIFSSGVPIEHVLSNEIAEEPDMSIGHMTTFSSHVLIEYVLSNTMDE